VNAVKRGDSRRQTWRLAHRVVIDRYQSSCSHARRAMTSEH
jgi:hypothetical protein